MDWSSWIGSSWPCLVTGGKIEVPPDLPHPASVGFQFVGTAMPNGQVADWALSFSDGIRVHLHEFADGRIVAHRDRYDPARGILDAIRHLFLETPLGVAGVVLGVVAFAGSRES